jgi:hypothetical protein
MSFVCLDMPSPIVSKHGGKGIGEAIGEFKKAITGWKENLQA